jgi:hypothetical protein
MDVAIRAANWLLAWDLFSGAGATFDDGFLRVFARSLREHGRHVFSSLDRSSRSGNHYLAELAGLIWLGAYLPSDANTDPWLSFAAAELLTEIPRQFHDDGSNFEGSTCYHRLSTETAIYAVAVLLRISERHPGRLKSLTWHGLPSGRLAVVPDSILERLWRAGQFTRAMTKPNGRVVQIGDNDSGRFFRLTSSGRVVSASEAVATYSSLAAPAEALDVAEIWISDDLDHSHIHDALAGLLGVVPEDSTGLGPYGTLARELARPSATWSRSLEARPPEAFGDTAGLARFDRRIYALPADRRRSISIPVPGDSILEEGAGVAFPDFGIYVFRSARLFLAVRCGDIGQGGYGGHDHNDQLGVELNVDGEDWIADPGTYVYTADPLQRDRYRSARAHFVPRLNGAEPASLATGVFELGAGSSATCAYWDGSTFAGELRMADGRVALCRVTVTDNAVEIVHAAELGELEPIVADSRWSDLLPQVQFSPGYGVQERPRG